MQYLCFYLLEVNKKRSCVKGHLFPRHFNKLKSKYQSRSLHLQSLTVLILFPSFSHTHSPSSRFELPLHVPCPAVTLTCHLPQSPLHGLCPAVTLTYHLPHSHLYMSPAPQSPVHVCPLPRSHPYISHAPQSPLHVPCPAVTCTCPLPSIHLTWPLPCSHPHMASALQSPIHVICPSHPYMSSALQSPLHGLCPPVTPSWPLPSHPYMASALQSPWLMSSLNNCMPLTPACPDPYHLLPTSQGEGLTTVCHERHRI